MFENEAKNKIFFPKDLKDFRIHFVGIKGTGMAALVEICVSRGAIVTGSDVPDHFYTDEILKKLNIIPYTEFKKENITDDIKLVVYSSAYKLEENPELVEATKKNIPCMLYSHALGNISAMSCSSGVAGVHGKTTTTGIAGTLVKALNLPAQVLAGSVIKSFSDNSTVNDFGSCTLSIGHKYFVAETCEYQRHFMDFHPQNIILTSVESDHQDYYPTFEDIQQAFIDYALLLPQNGNLIYCADDKGATDTAEKIKKQRNDINFIPYGFNAVGNFKILVHNVESGLQNFKIQLFENEVFSIKVPGIHNVRNATASIALMSILFYQNNEVENFSELSIENKVEFVEKIKTGLLDFSGSKRRSEILAQLKTDSNKQIIFIDDYGHHPTAIKTTLQGFKDFYPDKYLIVDFMSHTYSRTASLLDEFASSFTSADQVILHKIYSSARENKKDFEGVVSGQILFEKTKKYHKNVVYFEEILDAKDYVKNIFSSPLPEGKKGFVFVTMGAGDNWKLGTSLIKDFNI